MREILVLAMTFLFLFFFLIDGAKSQCYVKKGERTIYITIHFCNQACRRAKLIFSEKVSFLKIRNQENSMKKSFFNII